MRKILFLTSIVVFMFCFFVGINKFALASEINDSNQGQNCGTLDKSECFLDGAYCSWDENSGSCARNDEEPSNPGSSISNDALIPSYPASDVTGKINLSTNGLTIGQIFSALLPYVYVIAGLILLVMLIMGGLGLMAAAGNPDKMKVGYGKITNALIGFLIIFISYFVVQLVETILGITIL